MSRRCALIIGNSDYDDTTLSKLKTPEADVRTLSDVLRKAEVGGFDEVQELINQPEAVVSRAISTFFTGKKPDDMLLLYFSGHGILDPQGRLFLAVKDTQRDLLNATAIPATFITDDMDTCRSKRQLLILDCCHSGAFARGAKGSAPAMTRNTFEGNGYGRVVLTASDSTQYALEGDQVIEQAALSLFTHYLLEGLTTGEADAGQDGVITLDEWYDYAYERVASETPNQTPRKWVYNQQGELVIARNPAPPKTGPVDLPPELKEAISSRFVGIRVEALQELKRLFNGGNPALKQAARAALTRLAEQDDSRQVSSAAAAILAEAGGTAAGEQPAGPEPVRSDLESPATVEQPRLRQPTPESRPAEPKETKKQVDENAIPEAIEFSCQLRPKSIEAGQPARLLISNHSKASEAYTIRASDPESALSFTFTPPMVQIPPGASADVQVRAEPRAPQWFGGIRRRSIHVQVSAASGAVQTEMGEVVTGPGRISNRMLAIGGGILVVGLLCGVISIIGYNNITRGLRASQATSTAAAKEILVAKLTQDAQAAPTPTGDGGDTQAPTPTTGGIAAATPTTLPVVIKPTAAPGQVLFSSNRTGNWDIFLMNPDSSSQRQLTSNPADDSYPVFSPDGTQILFHSNREGNFDIFVMDLDGSHVTNLTANSRQADTFASWTPDGRQIVFQTKRDGPKNIYIMNADGSGQQLLITGQHGTDVSAPAVSPDGHMIVFVCDREGLPTICIYNIAGASSEYLVPDFTRQDDPSWSPDGGRVLYVESRASGQPMQVAIIDASGSSASIFRLSDTATDYSHPRLSSSGQYIYYEASTGGASDIYRYDVKSGSVEQLTSDPASDAEPWLR